MAEGIALFRSRASRLDVRYPDGWPPLPPKIPRTLLPRTVAAICCPTLYSITGLHGTRLNPFPSSSVAYRPTGEHDTPPIYADHALTVSRLPILQSGFGANILRGLRQLAPAKRREQVTGKDDSLPPCSANSCSAKKSALARSAGVAPISPDT